MDEATRLAQQAAAARARAVQARRQTGLVARQAPRLASEEEFPARLARAFQAGGPRRDRATGS